MKRVLVNPIRLAGWFVFLAGNLWVSFGCNGKICNTLNEFSF